MGNKVFFYVLSLYVGIFMNVTPMLRTSAFPLSCYPVGNYPTISLSVFYIIIHFRIPVACSATRLDVYLITLGYTIAFSFRDSSECPSRRVLSGKCQANTSHLAKTPTFLIVSMTTLPFNAI
jgi:hypothetical protein